MFPAELRNTKKTMPENRTIAATGPRVAVLVYDGLCTFEYGIAVEVFGLPRPEMGANWYRFQTCAVDPSPMRAVGGLEMHADKGLEALSDADLIIVPGWKGTDVDPPPLLLDALRRAHARGAQLMSICSGIFVLAATGLLTDQIVTTHWRYAEKLRSRYPQLTFNPDVLYVDAGQILTSAGSAAGLDLALHVVRRDFGVEVANKVARRLVLPAHRNGGQKQYVEKSVLAMKRSRISDVLANVRERLHHPFTVAELARIALMSERTLIRRFQETTGMSPAAWLTHERLEFARGLLERPGTSIEDVARLSGFGNSATLRLHFRRRLGISPTDYRRQFRSASTRTTPRVGTN